MSLQENGDLYKLKIKWWKQKRGGGQCQKGAKGSTAKSLGFDNLKGIFLVTFAGVFIALLVCIGELLLGTYQESQELGTTWLYEIKARSADSEASLVNLITSFLRARFAFTCSAFGKKERMASIRVKAGGNSLDSSTEDLETSFSERKGERRVKNG